MTEFPLRHGVWLAICDGRKALLVENKGDRQAPKLEMRAAFEHENPPTRELGSSAPGRAFSSAGNRRGSFEQTDFHQQAEDAFLRTFAGNLAKSVQEHEIRALYLIAPAKALGVIRRALPAAVQQVIIGELDRDYVKLPLYEIEAHLQRLH